MRGPDRVDVGQARGQDPLRVAEIGDAMLRALANCRALRRIQRERGAQRAGTIAGGIPIEHQPAAAVIAEHLGLATRAAGDHQLPDAHRLHTRVGEVVPDAGHQHCPRGLDPRQQLIAGQDARQHQLATGDKGCVAPRHDLAEREGMHGRQGIAADQCQPKIEPFTPERSTGSEQRQDAFAQLEPPDHDQIARLCSGWCSGQCGQHQRVGDDGDGRQIGHLRRRVAGEKLARAEQRIGGVQAEALHLADPVGRELVARRLIVALDAEVRRVQLQQHRHMRERAALGEFALQQVIGDRPVLLRLDQVGRTLARGIREHDGGKLVAERGPVADQIGRP